VEWILFIKKFRQDLQDKQDRSFQVFRLPAPIAYSPEGRKPGNHIAFGEANN
jgi:hypothetical protein